MSQNTQQQGGGTVLDREVEEKIAPPRMFKVLLHNDDYTTMEFVVAVLETVFHHKQQEAIGIMLHVHHRGVGVAGIFTHEIAETKARKVLSLAKKAGYPLMCTVEPET